MAAPTDDLPASPVPPRPDPLPPGVRLGRFLFNWLAPPLEAGLPATGGSPLLAQSRERIITAVARVMAVLGAAALVLTVPSAVRDGIPGLVLVFLLLWLAGMPALFRRLDYRLRAGSLLLIQYGVGLLDIVLYGLILEGQAFLFGFSVTAVILLGRRGGLAALGLSAGTLAGLGWLFSAGLFSPLDLAHSPMKILPLDEMLTTVMVFLMQTGLVVAGLTVLFHDYEVAWRRERQATGQISRERDLLEQRVAERTAELVEARDRAVAASQFKSELVAKVSHELRTPLGVVLGYAELLHDGMFGPVSAGQAQATADILENTHYLTGIVNDLLDEAKLEAGQLRLEHGAFAPAELLQTVLARLKVLADQKRLDLTGEIDPALPAVLLGDRVRLQQILINLAGNSLKFTRKGRVQLRLYRPQPDWWAISVADTGPGIPPEAQNYIFEPFRQVDGSPTREHRGSGLGLAIVRQLVTLMQGDVTLESRLGEGSTFTVWLPLHIPGEEE